ncbi:hypothetical protein BT69DRAFT_1283146 [Atractiella rhizophila]|nr:hypothetical protein BT69DRAFT_1283146 [Atractiella rhizophila]
MSTVFRLRFGVSACINAVRRLSTSAQVPAVGIRKSEGGFPSLLPTTPPPSTFLPLTDNWDLFFAPYL